MVIVLGRNNGGIGRMLMPSKGKDSKYKGKFIQHLTHQSQTFFLTKYFFLRCGSGHGRREWIWRLPDKGHRWVMISLHKTVDQSNNYE